MQEDYDEDDLSLADSQEGLGSPPASQRDEDAASMLSNSSSNSASSGPSARARASAGSFKSFLLSAALAEFVGTFFLIFIGLSALYCAAMIGADALSTGSLLMLAIGYGFSYGTLVYAFSLNGGGYVPSIRQMNPALTLCLYLLGKLDAVKAGVIVVAQVRAAVDTVCEARLVATTSFDVDSLSDPFCCSSDRWCYSRLWCSLSLFRS